MFLCKLLCLPSFSTANFLFCYHYLLLSLAHVSSLSQFCNYRYPYFTERHLSAPLRGGELHFLIAELYEVGRVAVYNGPVCFSAIPDDTQSCKNF